jgi:D-glycero-alpha-D-manno-heptose-7-phosphate kinase
MSSPLVLRATAPTRLDFGGGWTDVPPYPEERGGFVCNLAIERRATVTLRAATGEPLPGTSPPPTPTAGGASAYDAAPLARAALLHAGLPSLHAELASDFPVGAGLGGSSAAGVAIAAALHVWQERPAPPAALAEWSRAVEVERLGIAGGRQDHYAAAFGGALALEFSSEVAVTPIPLTADTTAAIEQRLLVYYTGESRISGDTIRAVLDGYRARQSAIVFALDRMAALARFMATALTHGDLDALGALVGEHWEHQRALHTGISTPRIDAIVAAARSAGALGTKALGASGGGCVLVVAPAEGADAVDTAVRPLATPLPWRVAACGVTVRRLDPG